MKYFDESYLTFFAELTNNNQKSWFDENRKRYENHVKKPFYRFLEDLISEISKFDPAITISPKEAVFRINRDIRFSKDKTPYKTHMAAIISSSGRKDMEVPGLYLQFSATDVWLGGGSYAPSKDDLFNIRTFLLDNYDNMLDLLNNKSFLSICGDLKGEKNKVLPAEFKPFALDHPMMFNKQFYVMRQFPAETHLLSDKLIDFVVNHYKTLKPLNDFLNIARFTK